jgi:hypothetical protein
MLEIVGSDYSDVKPKTTKLVCVTYTLSTQPKGVKAILVGM